MLGTIYHAETESEWKNRLIPNENLVLQIIVKHSKIFQSHSLKVDLNPRVLT